MQGKSTVNKVRTYNNIYNEYYKKTYIKNIIKVCVIFFLGKIYPLKSNIINIWLCIYNLTRYLNGVDCDITGGVNGGL